VEAVNNLKDDLEDTFDRIDKNGDRTIEIEEFATLMLEMDRYASPTEMRACFDAIDSDHDGSVTFEEFRAWSRVGW
jgi:Ca2+-binding EF-hand superfamily protein